MADPKATGRTKRWRDSMSLMQNVLRAKEALTRLAEALDNILRFLIEAEAASEPTTPPPASPASPEARPSQRPTQYHEALDKNAFIRIVRTRFDGAKTEADRQAVRDLVTKAHNNAIISDDEKRILDQELK